jgi:hypothetical protein
MSVDEMSVGELTPLQGGRSERFQCRAVECRHLGRCCQTRARSIVLMEARKLETTSH